MALISVRNLQVDSRLRSLSFDLHEGEILGVIGPNGAGKSTLLNSLAGLEEPRGEIYVEGVLSQDLSPMKRARMIGLQPQEVSSAWSLTVEDVVELGRMPWGDDDNPLVNQAMELAGITELVGRKVDELSGGERARVWLARVLAGDPRVLLADEPIASLDIHHQLEVMEVLKSYAQLDRAVIVAMHDLSLAARYCDRLCLMKEGRVVAIDVPTQVLTESRLSEAFGVSVEVDLERHPPVVLAR